MNFDEFGHSMQAIRARRASSIELPQGSPAAMQANDMMPTASFCRPFRFVAYAETGFSPLRKMRLKSSGTGPILTVVETPRGFPAQREKFPDVRYLQQIA